MFRFLGENTGETKMRQQTFKEILEPFKEKMKKIADDTLSDIIGDYIPYAEDDKVSNVEFRTRDWLKAFFNGQADEYIKCPMLSEFDCQKARELIYQEHKEEIIKLIGKDFEHEIEILQNRLESLSRHRY